MCLINEIRKWLIALLSSVKGNEPVIFFYKLAHMNNCIARFHNRTRIMKFRLYSRHETISFYDVWILKLIPILHYNTNLICLIQILCVIFWSNKCKINAVTNDILLKFIRMNFNEACIYELRNSQRINYYLIFIQRCASNINVPGII